MTLLWRLSTSFRGVFMGIFNRSSRNAFVRSARRPGSQSNWSQRCSIRVEVRSLCRPVKFFHSKLINPPSSMSLWNLLLCTVRTGRGHPQAVAEKLRVWNIKLYLKVATLLERRVWVHITSSSFLYFHKQFGPQRDFTLFKSLLTLSSVAHLWHQREETLAHLWHLQRIF